MKEIIVENLYFSYDDEFIIEDVSFTIDAQQGCTLLVGRNGAGKSTLLNVLCNLMESDGGRITRDGIRIAYLPFDSPLYPHLTILENLRYFYRNFRGKDFDVKDEEVKYVLEALSIDYLSQRFDKCSSGQQQKAGIAVILLSGADVMIMDEPFIAIDATSCHNFVDVIAEMKYNHSFLITTHTIQRLESVCDHILMLDHHKLGLDSRDREVIHQYFKEDTSYDIL